MASVPHCRVVSALLLCATATCATAGEWSGYVALENRYFPNDALSSEQHDNYLSIAAEPEYYRDWDDGRQSFTFVPFVRIDQYDDERTHADIRELEWIKAAEKHEWRIGVRKVFWGVTEFQHLVDIINQTDLVENIDGEDKLGQPMINFALIRDWGTLDLFALVGFRERTFPGEEGRFRTTPPIDPDQSNFESSAETDHIDFAIRWSHTLGDWDMGVYYFSGTSRDPRFTIGIDDGAIALVPFYDQIDQTGVDVQATKGNWLWKLEAIYRSGQGDSFAAATGGFEYTFVGVAESGIDLGVVSEYLFDDRDEDALTPFEDDLALGLRLTFNDAQSTELLFGVITDLDDDARVWRLEASRRLRESYKLSVEARVLSNIPPEDLFLFGLRNDDFIQVELARFF